MALKASFLGALPLLSAVLLSLVVFVLDSGRGKKLDAFAATLPLIVLAVYRVLFHPLSKYPGPLSHKITTFPITYHAVKGTRHKYLRQLHDRYGPVVRIGPDELSFITPTAVQRIYTSAKAFEKSHVYDLHPAVVDKSEGLFFLQDRERHLPRRKLWNKTITATALRDYRPAIIASVDKLLLRLLQDQKVKGSVDAGRVFDQWAFDCTNDVWFGGRAFGETGRFLDTDDLTLPIQGSSELILFDMMAYLPLLFYLVKDLPVSQKYRQFERLSKVTAKRLLAENVEPHEGISYLINDSDAPLNPKDLPFEIETVIIGGSDTVHAMSTFILFFLATQPSWKERIRNELVDALKGESVSSNVSILDELPLFNAFINESMRMGQAFSGLPRVAPPEGAIVDGHYVPGGTTVGVPINAYHMDYDSFGPDAREFNPSRWLDSDSGASKYPSLVFGAGRGKCVGMKIAYLELRIMFANVLLRIDVELAEGFEKAAFWDGIRNWRSHEFVYPLTVNIRAREAPA